MKDYYYKFPSENIAINMLDNYHNGNSWIYASINHCLLPIGQLIKFDNSTTDTSWHINLRLFDDEKLPPASNYLVFPETPTIKWA